MEHASAISEKLIYRLSYGSFGQFIKVSLTVKDINAETLEIFLSSWRPGRYELGNFAKNIRHFKVRSSGRNELPFQKVSKDRWLVMTHGNTELTIEYEYYAVKPDAGSCWLNHDVFYINPIHCCIGIKGMEDLPCRVILELPENFKTATSMVELKNGHFSVSGYDELVDSPVLASPGLLHNLYSVNGITFHIWFYGIKAVDWNKVIADFRAFTEMQLNTMEDFPVTEYHFLSIALPFRFYHGVEHLKSTVLAIGPAGELMDGDLYSELIGVASHELFHVWNVKTIRPAEMLPYRYHCENYSTSGWVYEGITTYYGELFLMRSGFFSTEKYFAEMAARLQKHLDNPGKENYNVLESSFDTWLDGYEPGVPGRKTSIYDEGFLVALIFDLYIRKKNAGKSLDDFVRLLYHRFGKTRTGYTHFQLQQLFQEVTGEENSAFFDRILLHRGSYLPFLKDLFENLAVEIELHPNSLIHERCAGFRMDQSKPNPRVSIIQPGSPAEKAGLMHGDEVSALVESGNTLQLSIIRFGRPAALQILFNSSRQYFDRVNIKRKPEPHPEQEAAYRHWIKGGSRAVFK
jgi:predicted metalloprotease with PDZ domain